MHPRALWLACLGALVLAQLACGRTPLHSCDVDGCPSGQVCMDAGSSEPVCGALDAG